jgi:phosphomannomutase
MQGFAESRNFEALTKALVPRIAFGTAGLRAKMAAGYAYMNYVTVQQTTQGLSSYLKETMGEELCTRGVVVGYDARHNSKEYAQIVAKVFKALGFPVHLFSRTVCTPLVPFTVVFQGCIAGVMVTASHNPKQDNGYKVYWRDGAQIVDPHDANVTQAILANLPLWELPAELTGLEADITDQMMDEYVKASVRLMCRSQASNRAAQPIVYTPMHGVGYELVKLTFEGYNHPPPITVPLQVTPDPEFPTVRFPNPEEGEGALKLAMQTAEETGARLVLANDPDADRLAVAERQLTGEWRVFTGDEVASFLADWELSHFRGEKGLIVASTVSSKMTRTMALAHNCRFEEVLTGFKWIVKKSLELLAEGWVTILSYEEAIGYCIGDLVRDKDGVTGAAVFTELYNARCVGEGITLTQHLQNLYERYGYYLTKNKYVFCYDPPTIERVFNTIRVAYPERIGNFEVRSVRDLTVGFDSSQPDNKPTLPVFASTQMVNSRSDHVHIRQRSHRDAEDEWH